MWIENVQQGLSCEQRQASHCDCIILQEGMFNVHASQPLASRPPEQEMQVQASRLEAWKNQEQQRKVTEMTAIDIDPLLTST